MSANGGHFIFVREWRTFVREWRTSVRERRTNFCYIIFWRTIFLADMSATGGLLSAADLCPRRTIFADKVHHGIFGGLFLADCPRVDGGSDRIRSDPPRTLADFLCPHKVRLSPPESAEKRSSADTWADSGGQWRTQADPIGSAADSGGQLSASFSAKNCMPTAHLKNLSRLQKVLGSEWPFRSCAPGQIRNMNSDSMDKLSILVKNVF